MDRELAIERLNEMWVTCDMEECNVDCDLCAEALDLAIEALSEPQITLCKDCVWSERCTQSVSHWDEEGDGEIVGAGVLTACSWGQAKKSDEKHQLSGETSTCKLKKDHDFLIKPDSEACKEQKSKLDCISRQQAIEAIEKEIERIRENPCAIATEGDFYYQNALKLAQEIIELQPPVTPTDKVVDFNNMISGGGRIRNLPPVTPTERTGAWIEDGYYDSPFRVCSHCGYEHQNQRGMWKFCPNCGAKMGGDTE